MDSWLSTIAIRLHMLNLVPKLPAPYLPLLPSLIQASQLYGACKVSCNTAVTCGCLEMLGRPECCACCAPGLSSVRREGPACWRAWARSVGASCSLLRSVGEQNAGCSNNNGLQGNRTQNYKKCQTTLKTEHCLLLIHPGRMHPQDPCGSRANLYS